MPAFPELICSGGSLDVTSVLHVLYIFSRSIDRSTALRNFNHHLCKSDVHIATLLITRQIFVAMLESEINPISQTPGQLLKKTVSKSREKSSIVNTSCSVEGIVYHLEATYVVVAINIVPTFSTT